MAATRTIEADASVDAFLAQVDELRKAFPARKD